MIETILGILLIFVLVPSNEVAPDLVIQSQHSPKHLELEVEDDEQSGEDCRYTEESIPHRDLSEYVVLEEISVNANEEGDSEQSVPTEQTDSEKVEEDQDRLELARPHTEEED